MFGFYGAMAILVGAGLWLWWIRRLDRFEPERLRDLLRIGLLGGAFSIVMTLVLGAPILLVRVEVPYFLLAGVNEEVAKSWATVVLLKRRDLVDEPVDVLVYALTVSMGFALLENFLYLLHGGPWIPVTRSLFSLPAHLCFAMVWAVPLTPLLWGTAAKAKPYRWVLPFVLLAGLVHGASNLVTLHAKGWLGLAWLGIPLTVMAIFGRHFLKKPADQSPFQPLPACPFCGREVGAKSRSQCVRCGSPLARTFFRACPSCEGPVPPAARFCQHCGAIQAGGDSDVP
jgi:RsiW-degrading membrane proteinase PrsW (M82 family)